MNKTILKSRKWSKSNTDFHSICTVECESKKFEKDKDTEDIVDILRNEIFYACQRLCVIQNHSINIQKNQPYKIQFTLDYRGFKETVILLSNPE